MLVLIVVIVFGHRRGNAGVSSHHRQVEAEYCLGGVKRLERCEGSKSSKEGGNRKGVLLLAMLTKATEGRPGRGHVLGLGGAGNTGMVAGQHVLFEQIDVGFGERMMAGRALQSAEEQLCRQQVLAGLNRGNDAKNGSHRSSTAIWSLTGDSLRKKISASAFSSPATDTEIQRK